MTKKRKEVYLRIINKVALHEKEFNRPLKPNSFYKQIALRGQALIEKEVK